MSTLRLTNLAIEQDMTDVIDIDLAVKDFAMRKSRKVKF
jgi:hypothetical protein